AGLDASALTITKNDTTTNARPATTLVPRADSSSDVRTTTVTDGTTDPSRNTVQVIDTSGTTADFALHFVLPGPTGELVDVHTGFIHPGASAADMLNALDAVLNPNNVNPALPFTDNVGVEKHGSTFTITLRGSMAGREIEYVEVRRPGIDVLPKVTTRID